jgi:hypothetical protein
MTSFASHLPPAADIGVRNITRAASWGSGCKLKMSDYGHLACHQLDLLALPRTARAYGGSNCGKKRIDTEIFLYLRTSCINPLATSVSATPTGQTALRCSALSSQSLELASFQFPERYRHTGPREKRPCFWPVMMSGEQNPGTKLPIFQNIDRISKILIDKLSAYKKGERGKARRADCRPQCWGQP